MTDDESYNKSSIATYPVITTLFVVTMLIGVYELGHWMGTRSELGAAKLSAANEIIYNVVRIGDAPSPQVVDMAKDSCRGNSYYAECITDFIAPFQPAYLVNQVTGVYSRIGDSVTSPSTIPKQ